MLKPIVTRHKYSELQKIFFSSKKLTTIFEPDSLLTMENISSVGGLPPDHDDNSSTDDDVPLALLAVSRNKKLQY
jgi:hypothetical protein